MFMLNTGSVSLKSEGSSYQNFGNKIKAITNKILEKISKLFERIIKAFKASESHGEIVEFKKGEKRLKDLAPMAKDKLLGRGANGLVCEHANDCKKVVKKVFGNGENECDYSLA